MMMKDETVYSPFLRLPPSPARAPVQASRSMICTGDHVVQGRLGVNTFSPQASMHIKDRAPCLMLEENQTGTVATIGMEGGELMVQGAGLVSIVGSDLRIGGNLVVNSVDVLATIQRLPEEMAREIAKHSGADLAAPVTEVVQGLEETRNEMMTIHGSLQEMQDNLTTIMSRVASVESEHDRIIYNTNLQESIRGLKGVMDGITMANNDIRSRMETMMENSVRPENLNQIHTTISENMSKLILDNKQDVLDLIHEQIQDVRTTMQEQPKPTVIQEDLVEIHTRITKDKNTILEKMQQTSDRLHDIITAHKTSILQEMDRLRVMKTTIQKEPEFDYTIMESMESRLDFIESGLLITTEGNQTLRALYEEVQNGLEQVVHQVSETEINKKDRATTTVKAMTDLREEVMTRLSGFGSQMDTLSDSFMALNTDRGGFKKNMSDLERSMTQRMDRGFENVMNITGYQGKTMQNKISSVTEQYAFSGPMAGMFAMGTPSMGMRVDVGSNVISSLESGTIYFRLCFEGPPIVLLTLHTSSPDTITHVVTTQISELSFSWRRAHTTDQDTTLSWIAMGK